MLIRKIEQFLRRTDMPATTFGRLAVRRSALRLRLAQRPHPAHPHGTSGGTFREHTSRGTPCLRKSARSALPIHHAAPARRPPARGAARPRRKARRRSSTTPRRPGPASPSPARATGSSCCSTAPRRIEAAERFIAFLPEHEFDILGQLVADASGDRGRPPASTRRCMTVRCELLLLEEGRQSSPHSAARGRSQRPRGPTCPNLCFREKSGRSQAETAGSGSTSRGPRSVPPRQVDLRLERLAGPEPLAVAQEPLGRARLLAGVGMPERCMVMCALSSDHSGWPGGSGSGSVRSSTAAAMRRSAQRLDQRGLVDAVGASEVRPAPPRASSPPGSAAPIMPLVSGVPGSASTIQSNRPSWCRQARGRLRLTAKTSTPKPSSARPIACPIAP